MHGVQFGSHHTLDWGLTLIDFKIESPAPKTKYIELPIGNGSIDLTEAIYGDISYSDRKATFVFGVKVSMDDRPYLQDLITSALHGRRMKIIVPDDLSHYYMGRLTAGPLRMEGTLSKIEITAVCEPYKYKTSPTILSGTVPAEGEKELLANNARMRTIPKITVSAAATISHGGNSYSVQAGTWKLTNIVLTEGSNPITITAAAGTTYSIEYQEATI